MLGLTQVFCEDEVVEPSDDTPESPLLARANWYPASPPIAPDADYPPGAIAVDRESVRWYNIEPELGAHRRDFDPTLSEQENTLVETIDIEFDAVPGGAQPWSGIMRGFPGKAPVWSNSGDGPLDLSDATSLVIWINDFKPDSLERGGSIYIELGVMDEDFHRPADDGFDLEDKTRDGFAAAFDDTGLDGLFNDAEPDLTGDPADPSGDDIDTRRIGGKYLKINGTEGNILNDTEDLDGSGELETINGYFRYRIDLADPAEVDVRAQYPGYDGFGEPGHENDAWRRYRIDLSDYEAVIPDGVLPQFHDIRHMRIWFKRMDEVLDPTIRRLQIARLHDES